MAGELSAATREALEEQYPGCKIGVGPYGQLDITPKGRTTEEQAAIVQAELARRAKLAKGLAGRAGALSVLGEVA